MSSKLERTVKVFILLLGIFLLSSCQRGTQNDSGPVYVPDQSLYSEGKKNFIDEVTILFGDGDTVQIIQSKRNSLISEAFNKITCKKTSLHHSYFMGTELIRKTVFRPDSIEVYDEKGELLWYLKAARDHLALVSPGSVLTFRASSIKNELALEKNDELLCSGKYNSAISRYRLSCGNRNIQIDAPFFHPGFLLCGSNTISKIDIEVAINELILLHGPGK